MRQPRAYSILQIALHWTIAALVIAQFVVNEAVRAAFQARVTDDQTSELDGLPAGAVFHIVSGLAILALTALRLTIRLIRGAPPPEEGIPPVIAHVAALTHVLFYALLIAIPVTGAVAWFAGSALAGTLHEIGRLILLPAILAHALGALAEHFVLRNDTLRRMLAMTDR